MEVVGLMVINMRLKRIQEKYSNVLAVLERHHLLIVSDIR